MRLSLSKLRRAKRRLLYVARPEFRNLVAPITSAHEAASELFDIFPDVLPLDARVAQGANPLAVAKYGILDLAYDIGEASSFPCDPIALRALRDDLGLIERGGAQDSLDCLDDLLDEADAGRMYFRVILETDMPDSIQDRFRFMTQGFPPDFWPRPFTVRDACLTNAPGIWRLRHFYL